MISIGSTYGVPAIYGAIIAAGLIVVLAAGFFGKLVRFFPPVVTGSVVMIIGISLIPTAMNNLVPEVKEAKNSAHSTTCSSGLASQLLSYCCFISLKALSAP
nr:solute carrier family 23 protein [Bacillus subtilis]